MNPTDDAMGTVLREGSRWGLRYRRHLAHSPEKVWRALTESAHLRHWMPCDLVGGRHEGAALEVKFWPGVVDRYQLEDPVLPGEIRVWDPPRVFEWTWDTDVLRWELQAVPDGTVLVFTTWLGDGDPAVTSKTAAGYHACLQRLAELLDSGSVATPPLDAEMRSSEERYAMAVRDAARERPAGA